jgi:hypothetical protein
MPHDHFQQFYHQQELHQVILNSLEKIYQCFLPTQYHLRNLLLTMHNHDSKYASITIDKPIYQMPKTINQSDALAFDERAYEINSR